MSDAPFHLTLMGKRFFESTMPALVEAIEKLNQNLERMAARLDSSTHATPPPVIPPTGS